MFYYWHRALGDIDMSINEIQVNFTECELEFLINHLSKTVPDAISDDIKLVLSLLNKKCKNKLIEFKNQIKPDDKCKFWQEDSEEDWVVGYYQYWEFGKYFMSVYRCRDKRNINTSYYAFSNCKKLENEVLS